MASISAPSRFSVQSVEPFKRDSSWKSHYVKKESALDQISRFCSTYLNPISWTEPTCSPLKMGKLELSQLKSNKELVVFGDIHGEIFGFIENLLNAELIDEEGNWAGKDQVLVQLGDVIDRGYASEAAWEYLSLLQLQAENSKGEVVRLIGNHELLVLEGYYHYAAQVIQNPKAFAEKVKAEIISGKVKLAYTDGKRLFVHAGLRTEMRDLLVKELMEKKECSSEEIYLKDLVTYVNELLVKAVQEEDFSHPIFDIGVSRGGNKKVGGILWEDLSELIHSQRALDIPQVIGHNPPRQKDDPLIRISESQKLVEVDAGLNPIYGGNKAYVIFNPSEIKVRAKDPEKQQWIEMVAQDYLLRSCQRS